ncbi:MAG: bifunctional diaminohydroxyphosphoribosylaminopyrimidine deaminase/5-amino-6-(5-phosphoribosylamino)uracil reductase RibD [Bacteroidia bacterium]|nr:bifunctional diaminohydroxyphosphoribosylaminopyrimidine deaminase/5-amino-6-(5-phosphoribosylamino)uracil reductase RibD [Bacteroidia bacterium]
MDFSTEHKKYMQRCLELASGGLGNTAPNPMVGCVIVHDHKIIGEGYHIRYGEAHAEVNAINSVKQKALLEKSTLYVNLEPCSHYGKTPPCSNLIIEKKIPYVVVGCIDTFSQVSGNGIRNLKNSGCKVIVEVLQDESRELNRRFFTFHEKKRPYVILKWAQTVDNFIDKIRKINAVNEPTRITNDICNIWVHKWRAEEDAFMVGTNTAINDNPRLTTREWAGKNPLRVVLDKDLRIPLTYHIFDQSAPTLIFTNKKAISKKNIEYCKIKVGKNMLRNILTELHARNIQSVVVEGGAQLLNNFIEENLWDEARVFTADTLFYKGLSAPKINGTIIAEEKVGNAVLKIFRNT